RRAPALARARQADQRLCRRLPAAPREGQGEARPRAGVHPLMRMSRERIFHLADLIVKELGATPGVHIKAPDDLRPEVIRALTDESKLEESIDGEVRKILGSYSRPMPEGTAYEAKDLEAPAAHPYDNKDIGASIASASFRTGGMVIAPCSIKTAGAIASCHSDSLIARAADVTLKEGRPLILLVRETPLHLGHLKCMVALAEMGAVILPPMPAFYARPKDIDDVVNHTI